jgi:hypothetical protein
MQIAIISGRIPRENKKRFHKTIDSAVRDFLDTNKPQLVYTTLELGAQRSLAKWCIANKIPYIAALPFKNLDIMWSTTERERHRYFLRKAAKVILVDRQPNYMSLNMPPDVPCVHKYITAYNFIINKLEAYRDKLIEIIPTRKGEYTSRPISHTYNVYPTVVVSTILIYPGFYEQELNDDDVPF